MKDKNLLQCCQSVLNFIEEDYSGQIPSPMQKVMNEVLVSNGWGNGTNGDMINFTKYLNDIFQIGYTIEDENKEVKKFFTEHSRQFYKRIIRDLKIKSLYEKTF